MQHTADLSTWTNETIGAGREAAGVMQCDELYRIYIPNT